MEKKSLEYYKTEAENYWTECPFSVLKYISALEKELKQKNMQKCTCIDCVENTVKSKISDSFGDLLLQDSSESHKILISLNGECLFGNVFNNITRILDFTEEEKDFIKDLKELESNFFKQKLYIYVWTKK